MDLFACGYNESAGLLIPPSCPRQGLHLGRPAPCAHNDWGKDPNGPIYCPLMPVKMTRIKHAEHSVRVIYADHSVTILEVDGALKVLGHNPFPETMFVKVLQHRGNEVLQIVRLDGMSEFGILYRDGSVQTLDYKRDGSMSLNSHRLRKDRLILHMALGTCDRSTWLAIVTRVQPTIVLMFEKWKAAISWLEGDSAVKSSSSIELANPISQLVGNWDGFTARTQDENVYTWAARPHKPAPLLQSISLQQQQQQQQAQEDPINDPDDSEDNDSNIQGLLDDLSENSEASTQEPQPPKVTKLRLPPILKVAASGAVTAAISTDSQLYLWTNQLAGAELGYPNIAGIGITAQLSLVPIVDSSGAKVDVIDIALSRSHVIALTADRAMFAVGEDEFGQLGRGEARFRDEAREWCENHQSGDPIFAREWQSMETEGLLGEDEEIAQIFCGEETSFMVKREKRKEKGLR